MMTTREYLASEGRDCCGIMGRYANAKFYSFNAPRPIVNGEIRRCAGYRIMATKQGNIVAIKCGRKVLLTELTGSNSTIHAKCAVCLSHRHEHRTVARQFRSRRIGVYRLMCFLTPQWLWSKSARARLTYIWIQNMKIFVAYDFKEGPWGGANQFLKALTRRFEQVNVRAMHPDQADVFLFNSHHHPAAINAMKDRHPNKAWVHRIDGPTQLVRGYDDQTDAHVFELNNRLATATIFQSQWSRSNTERLGYAPNGMVRVIQNASDPLLFYPPKVKVLGKKIIATSWSDNVRKGFDVYEYLDKNLDFSQYEFTFVGRSPIRFKNIQHIMPCDSKTLGHVLRKNAIYITASKNDPCSNAVIEALSCGLHVVYLDSGGNPELVREFGTPFTSCGDVCDAIKQAELLTDSFAYTTIAEVADQYIAFFEEVLRAQK